MKIITKACRVLDLFLDNGDELSLEEIARLSGLNKATARRIAASLVENNFLKQYTRRGKYSLGMHFLDFSEVIKRNNRILNAVSPYLINLSRSINEGVSLVLWDGFKATLVRHYNTDNLLKVVPEEGTRINMHSTAMGKAILAEIPDEDIAHYLIDPFVQNTPNTLNTLEALKEHLRLVRQDGVAFDDEERAPGVRGIATTFKTRNGDLAGAIGILGPSVRLSRERMRELVPIIKKCSEEITAGL